MNYEGNEFPVSQKQYNKIEKQNSTRINVFGYEKGQPFPIHISKETLEELHNLHNDYLVVPEKLNVSNNMLSGYCEKIAEKYNISIGLVRKLIPMLKGKKEYVLHCRNLQLYMDLGLKIKKSIEF